jgi:RNA polymerase sigma-70 factor (ECF subfamily)
MNKEHTDEYLMSCFRDHGDYRYLEELTERYGNPALNFARQFLFERENAQDAVQETFIKIFRESGNFNSSYKFAPWFYRILRNTCFDMLRKRKAYDDYIEKYETVEQETIIQAPEQTSVSREYLRHLTDEEREIVLLKIVDDLTFEDIAKIVGCSVEAAKKRGQRALGRLRTLAQKHEAEATVTGT